MARPRTIAPNGDTVRLTVTVSETTRRRLEKQAKAEGKSLGAIMRQALEKVA